jgi:N6-L-threonylcarbamoyladenine synthase
VLGIETSCDETAAAVVEDGRTILSSVVTSQVADHAIFRGVVPEIASRKHLEYVNPVVDRALDGIGLSSIDVIAVTAYPGLIGALMVGISTAKGLALASGKPFVAVNHVEAHLYSPQLEGEIAYPYVGLVASGGHTLLAEVTAPGVSHILGSTLDDAAGEAFDKVAKTLDLEYPGGPAIDRIAPGGNPSAHPFPLGFHRDKSHRYDFSYSGLKTAVIFRIEQLDRDGIPWRREDIAASFRKAAIDILLLKLAWAAEDLGIPRVALTGGVACNAYLREEAPKLPGLEVHLPAFRFTTDNAAMVAGLGCHLARRGEFASWSLSPRARL